MPAERVAAKIVHDPILMGTGAARSLRVRIVKMWSVGRAVAGKRERGPAHPCFYFLRGGKQCTHASGAGLHDRWAGDVTQSGPAGDPGQPIERMGLRHTE